MQGNLTPCKEIVQRLELLDDGRTFGKPEALRLWKSLSRDWIPRTSVKSFVVRVELPWMIFVLSFLTQIVFELLGHLFTFPLKTFTLLRFCSNCKNNTDTWLFLFL